MKELSLKRNFLFYFFLLCPLALLPVDELMMDSDSGGHIVNYLSVVLVFLFVLLFPPVTVNRTIINIFVMLVGILAINNLFAPYASNKIFLNQVGFVLCSFIVATTYATVTEEQKNKLQRLVEKAGLLGLGVLLLCSFYLIMWHFDLLERALITGDFNSFIYELSKLLNWEKQSLGNFAALIFSVIFVLKRRIWLTLLIPCIPMLAGIRVLSLGAVSAVLLVGIKRKKNLLWIIPVIFILSFVVYNKAFVSGFERLGYDIRIISFLNAFDIVKQMPFGVGLGGYHVYALQNESYLIREFQTYYEVYKQIPTAPESDIVAVFGSLGVFLGGIFYAVNLWVAVKLYQNYNNLSNIDKVFSFNFFLFLFLGTFQDNMFSLFHWIYFGFALGTLVANSYRKPSQVVKYGSSAESVGKSRIRKITK